MRYLTAIIFAAFIATPTSLAMACEMEGPRNCMELNDAALIQATKNTVHKMELVNAPHPFRTQNDVVLENAARQTAQLKEKTQNRHPDWAFWRN